MNEAISFQFQGRVLRWDLVGSRVTCNPPPTDTDQDILVLVSSLPEWRKFMGEQGYEPLGSFPTDIQVCNVDAFESYRKGELNFIATEDQQFYRKFTAASSVAKKLNLMDKEDRIILFQAVLYGNSYGPSRFKLTMPREFLHEG